jgi:pantetheine-phosphate adenylyltransferase
MSSNIAVYAGSFDPFTLGHVDIAQRGSNMFDKLIIAIGCNPAKRYLFTYEQRKSIIEDSLSHCKNIQITSFEGLLVNYCKNIGANFILRGLRSEKDLAFELPMGLANMDMAPEIESIFLLSNPKYIFISSSLMKEIALNGGDTRNYLPSKAVQMITAKLDEDKT